MKAIQEGQKITTLATADARKIQVIAEAQGVAEAKIGLGKAIAVSEQVKAYGGPGYQVAQDVMARVAAAIQESGVQIVPSTVISMGDGDGHDGTSAFSNLLGLLMTLTTSEKLGVDFSAHEESPERQAAIDAIKDQLLEKLAADPVPPPAVVAAPIDDAAAALKAALDASTAATADAGSPTGEAAAPATASVTAPVATGAVTSAAGAALDVTIAAATQAQPAAVDEVKSSTTGGDQPHGDGVDRWLAQNQAAMPGAPKAKKRPRKPAGPAGD